MPSLSRLFHSRSSLKSSFKTQDHCIQPEHGIESSNVSQAELHNIRARINAARNALIQLDVLVTALQDNVDTVLAVSSRLVYPPSSSVGVSITIDLQDMKRSTESLAKTLRKNAPLPPTPSDAPIHTKFAGVPKSRSALYPAPLRLPLRDSPSSTHPVAAPAMYRDERSPFDQEIIFLDSQLRQRHSLNSVVPCTEASVKRPISLPIPTFDKKVAHATYGPHFSTKAKTQKLRSMQQDVPLLNEERPLSMDELLQFLRKGNSMREL